MGTSIRSLGIWKDRFGGVEHFCNHAEQNLSWNLQLCTYLESLDRILKMRKLFVETSWKLKTWERNEKKSYGFKESATGKRSSVLVNVSAEEDGVEILKQEPLLSQTTNDISPENRPRWEATYSKELLLTMATVKILSPLLPTLRLFRKSPKRPWLTAVPHPCHRDVWPTISFLPCWATGALLQPIPPFFCLHYSWINPLPDIWLLPNHLSNKIPALFCTCLPPWQLYDL